MSLALTLAESAEFTCGNYCIDMDKIMALKEKKLYSSLWPVTKIEVRKKYPKDEGNKEIECENDNYPKCNLITVYQKEGSDGEKAAASSYVKLCRKEKEPSKINYRFFSCPISARYKGWREK